MTPFYVDSRVTLLQAHVLDALDALPDESAHCVVTSPPYWGLRDYGLPAQIWGGDPDCTHRWGPAIKGKTEHARLDHSHGVFFETRG